MIPQEKKLLELLSNNDVTFFIPPYQRNYEWTKDQCEVFMEDVRKTCEANINGKMIEHFFGAVTFFQNETVFGQPTKLVLIDGQQRITTTMLFLVALRDTLEDANLKDFIDSKYLKNANVQGDSEYKIKLKQVETDWVAYKKIILLEELDNQEMESHVYKNYKFFCDQLKDLSQQGFEIQQLIQQGISKFSIITIELQPRKNEWENPQEIFESMNSLGKPLSLADLVRNYLLLGLDADTQNEYYLKYWLHIEKVIPNQVSNFIRDYMQVIDKKSFSKATDANHKELYGNFKKMFKEFNAKDLLEDLSNMATMYSYIVTDAHTGSNEVDYILGDLTKLNLSTAYSFIMELIRQWKCGLFTEKDVIDILDAFKTYVYRRRLILGLTSSENKSFPLLVRQLDKLAKASDKRTKMFEILSHQESAMRLPNDIELTRVFETLNFYNFKYCKLYLAMIEEKITKSRPDLTDKKLQIEHILPQTLNDEWKDELGDDAENIHQALVNTIGNLTLIRHNQELGQKSFIEKKEVYENNAGLQIAKTNITNRKRWNKDSITKRTKWIVDYILNNVFPIPDSMRRTNNFVSKEGRYLSFEELQLIGLDIAFIDDPAITVKVVADKEVEFEGKRWKLSPLTREIYTRKGKVTKSGAYQGAQYWSFDGIKLADIM